jgi:5'-3' exoribonuclease 2
VCNHACRFYPFYHHPFAIDLVVVLCLTIEFNLGKPFSPFNQLIGVLPAASKDSLPKPVQ